MWPSIPSDLQQNTPRTLASAGVLLKALWWMIARSEHDHIDFTSTWTILQFFEAKIKFHFIERRILTSAPLIKRPPSNKHPSFEPKFWLAPGHLLQEIRFNTIFLTVMLHFATSKRSENVSMHSFVMLRIKIV